MQIFSRLDKSCTLLLAASCADEKCPNCPLCMLVLELRANARCKCYVWVCNSTQQNTKLHFLPNSLLAITAIASKCIVLVARRSAEMCATPKMGRRASSSATLTLTGGCPFACQRRRSSAPRPPRQVGCAGQQHQLPYLH